MIQLAHKDNVASVPAKLSTDWLKLNVGKRDIYLRQHEVVAFESVQQLTSNVPEDTFDNQISDTLNLYGQVIPVYCLSDEFELLNNQDKTHRVCVILKSREGMIGLTGTEVQPFTAVSIMEREVPVCMQTNGTPVVSIISWLKDRVMGLGVIISADALLNYVNGSQNA